MDGGLGVVRLDGCLTAAPVADQGADLHTDDLLPFDLLDQPCVDVLLGFPLRLVLTECPRAGELVVGDDHAFRCDALDVNSTAEFHITNICDESLFVDVVLCRATLGNNVQSRAKQLPQHIAHILLHLFVVLAAQALDAGWRNDFGDTVVSATLSVVISRCERDQCFGNIVFVRDFQKEPP